jgi:uncharacterized protein YydD (DUF2326 family)
LIHRIESTLPSFKSIDLGPGLNILTAEKSEDATDRQTRNGAGKSSVLDIIHFVLGGRCLAPKGDRKKDCIFRLDQLKKEFFGLVLDLREDRVSVARSGSEHGRILINSANPEGWPFRPTIDQPSGDEFLKAKEWNVVLGAEFFGLSAGGEKHAPSFRNVFPYFARREIDGGFATPEKFFAQQSVGDQQITLSFLIGLDWHISQELQLVRDKKKSFEIIKREARKGALERFVGNTGELRSQLTVAQNKANRLKRQIAAFEVLPEYHDLEREASALARTISDLANANTIDEQRKEQLRGALAEEEEPEMSDVVRLYEEAGVVLPALVVNHLESVRTFHRVVLRNRRSHLQAEIADADHRIDDRRSQMRDQDARRHEILEVLAAHGALDQLSRLQEEWTRLQATTEDLRRRYNDAKRLESLSSEIKLETAQLHQRLIRDLEEHQEVIDAAVLLFEEFSGALSEHQGHLTIAAAEEGPKFDVEVPSGRSVGIKNMQIFCFDLMLATLWTRKGLGPGFLIHDSHLFDGVDSRQVAKAIEIAARTAENEGFQYIMTMNSDAIPTDEFSRDFEVDEYILPVHLDDSTETGGLFGLRF